MGWFAVWPKRKRYAFWAGLVQSSAPLLPRKRPDGTRTRDQIATELRTTRQNVDGLIQFLADSALVEA